MMNAAIEFHDTEVVAVFQVTGAVVLRLKAYVHRSEGLPGYDPGSGWAQAIEMRFANGAVESLPATIPFVLDDGRMTGDTEFAGTVHLPMSVASAVQFLGHGHDGEQLSIWGAGVEVMPVAKAVYVDEFPGTSRS